MEKRIEVDEYSVIYYWFDKQYEDKLQLLDKKSVERQTVQDMLNKLYPSAVLKRTENGAPFLEDEGHQFISISHSKGWYAIYLSSKFPVGIDIQTPKKSLGKGKDYFVNSREESWGNEELNLHLIWGGKEAVFKKMKGLIADLKEEVTTIELRPEGKEILLEYKNRIEKASYFSCSDFILVWTIASN